MNTPRRDHFSDPRARRRRAEAHRRRRTAIDPPEDQARPATRAPPPRRSPRHASPIEQAPDRRRHRPPPIYLGRHVSKVFAGDIGATSARFHGREIHRERGGRIGSICRSAISPLLVSSAFRGRAWRIEGIASFQFGVMRSTASSSPQDLFALGDDLDFVELNDGINCVPLCQKDEGICFSS